VVKLFLDTNALYWALMKPHRLGRAATNRIELSNFVCFSAASVFELTLKSQQLGRNGRPKVTLPSGFGHTAIAAGFIEVPLRVEHAGETFSFLDFESGDPIDRMILAQAQHEDALLVTSDEKMLALGHDWIIDAQV
jgi:PIN domain nuclease of toxin-antitoxin system